MIIVDPETD